MQKIGLAAVLSKRRPLAVEHIQHLRPAIQSSRTNQVHALRPVGMTTGYGAKSQWPHNQLDALEAFAGFGVRAVQYMLNESWAVRLNAPLIRACSASSSTCAGSC